MTKGQKTLKALCVTLIGIIVIAMLGCSGMVDSFMPDYIDQDAIEYADESPTSMLPWTTIADGERIMLKIRFMHETNQIFFDRAKFDDKRTADRILEVQNRHNEDAKELRDSLFDPSAPGGLLLATLLGGTFGALAIPRPGDEKKKNPVA